MCSSDNYKDELIKISDPNLYEAEQWEKLAQARIFFGRQSVGKNIVDGLIDLQSRPALQKIKFSESIEESDFDSGLFLHLRIGENFNPKSKIDEFVKLLRKGMGGELDIAFMKLGYLDISNETDLNELFTYYRKSMDSIRKEYPDLKIIHSTVPLTVKPKGLKGIVKFILNRDYNKRRDMYNKMLRNYYHDEIIFDIAKLQSEYVDGTYYKYRDYFPGMIKAYSSDGGHLSCLGRKIIAGELAKVLLRAID